MEVVTAKECHAEIIHDLAQEIWWHTYKNILPDDQIAFMLQDMYAVTSIIEQMEEGDQFLLLRSEENFFGFVSFSESKETKVFRIHKLYIHPDFKGKGAGRFVIAYLSAIGLERGSQFLELNVNRNNPAKDFYLKMGFSIYQSVDISYHRFILNDYIMRKQLNGII